MGMPLSVDKCLVVHCGANNPKHHFQCGTIDLQETESTVDLGVTQSYLTLFKEHFSKIVQKSRCLVGLCFRTLQSRDPSFMIHNYKTYILPVLNYASSV